MFFRVSGSNSQVSGVEKTDFRGPEVPERQKKKQNKNARVLKAEFQMTLKSSEKLSFSWSNRAVWLFFNNYQKSATLSRDLAPPKRYFLRIIWAHSNAFEIIFPL